uniref:Retrovirus-related Pol polyprotein from transposon TNT 1-94-like beta-barrel domain-containing protein n=1 Tax=Chenopodium quinoa TaxID=63459 RepID=A0A803MUY4_CHEQI
MEIRFSQTNGARKYKLCRDVYDLKQNGRSLSDYYTEMSSLWEEIEGLNLLPPITEMNSEVNAFVSALNQQKDEQHLFQFLNGLDEDYTALRSQILMQSPLPTVELACAQIQQEESQRETLKGGGKPDPEPPTVMYGKGGNEEGYSVCGNKSHTAEHSNAQTQEESVSITAQQLEQLLKLVPSSSKTGYGTEEEIESGFAGMINCNNASSSMNEWILDSGASDHMISDDKLLDEFVPVKGNTKINLPNGGTAKITHIGNVLLKNGLHLKNVLCVPEFKHNLLSIHKLVRDEKYIVEFQPELCVIQDSVTLKTRALGRASHGLYYLMNDNLDFASKKKNAEVKRNNGSKEELVILKKGILLNVM